MDRTCAHTTRKRVDPVLEILYPAVSELVMLATDTKPPLLALDLLVYCLGADVPYVWGVSAQTPITATFHSIYDGSY
ncbi:hypothetical protein BJY00DRAFT_316705 [Aspergillus carlsbadensis]|nr:hypothetical protein BJY00DRAFT_316705 [Aspergillus carlsbadensis]